MFETLVFSGVVGSSKGVGLSRAKVRNLKNTVWKTLL